jgi:hypothetical protein
LVQTINKISVACPDLVYLEILLRDVHQYSEKKYGQEMHYSQWSWVQALCMLHVKSFTFCQPLPDSNRRKELRCEKEWKEEKEIERYVNDRIHRSAAILSTYPGQQ